MRVGGILLWLCKKTKSVSLDCCWSPIWLAPFIINPRLILWKLTVNIETIQGCISPRLLLIPDMTGVNHREFGTRPDMSAGLVLLYDLSVSTLHLRRSHGSVYYMFVYECMLCFTRFFFIENTSCYYNVVHVFVHVYVSYICVHVCNYNVTCLQNKCLKIYFL